MASQSVEWHKASLKSSLLCIESHKEELRRLTAKIERWELEFDYLQAQIKQAEADGISEFDPKQFKLKKNGRRTDVL